MISAIRDAVRSRIRRLIARAARGYVAGPRLLDARRTADELISRGYGITLAYWDGVGEDAAAVVCQHEWAIDDIVVSGGDYVSLKAPSFGYDHDAATALVTRARSRGVGVHFDSLDHDSVEPTLELIRSLPGGPGGVGITAPGRWRRSPEDAAELAAKGAIVRIVKGQWPDPGAPDLEGSQGFLAVTHAVAGSAGPVRIATHDGALATQALDILRHAGTAAEVELLYGLPIRHSLRVAAVHRVPVRVYIPYGHGWLPYALDGLKRNPRLLLRLMRDAVGGRYLRGYHELDRGR